MKIARYYCQHTELADSWRSRWNSGWQVFDREGPHSPQGAEQAIAHVRNVHYARRIRDALNSTAEKE